MSDDMVIKRGSILLRTGNIIQGMRNQSDEYLSATYWTDVESVKVMIKKVYTRERMIVSHIRRKM